MCGFAFRCLAAALVLSGCLSLVQGQDLQILRSGERTTVDSRSENGRLYYSVEDLLRAFNLSSSESGNQLRIQTSRGDAVLIEGRPLVRLGDQYLLLSSPTLKRRNGNWYVSNDFVDKVLPNILEERFSRQRDGSLIVEALGENDVRVEVTNYPDHVSVIFRSAQDVPIDVREMRDYIEVTFGGLLVKPEFIENPASTTVVSSIEFNPQEAYGIFRIIKGVRYAFFRQFRTGSPARLVVDVFGQDAAGADAGSQAADPGGQPAANDIGDTGPDSSVDQGGMPAVYDRPGDGSQMIVIDPGHGGEDYGVDLYSSDVLEKVLALDVGRMVEQRLSQAGYSTRLTRFRDVSLTAEQRSSIANFYRARVFVSLHVGGAPSTNLRGPVVYYFDAADGEESEASGDSLALVPWEEGQRGYVSRSQPLAVLLQQELNTLFGVENQPIKAQLSLLAPVQAPAILIETGFLTNREDLTLLSQREFQGQIAAVIAQTIQRFLSY